MADSRDPLQPKGRRPRWEAHHEHLQSLHPLQTWAYRQWWLYTLAGLVLLSIGASEVQDDRSDNGLLALGFAAFFLALGWFGWRHRHDKWVPLLARSRR